VCGLKESEGWENEAHVYRIFLNSFRGINTPIPLCHGIDGHLSTSSSNLVGNSFRCTFYNRLNFCNSTLYFLDFHYLYFKKKKAPKIPLRVKLGLFIFTILMVSAILYSVFAILLIKPETNIPFNAISISFVFLLFGLISLVALIYELLELPEI